MELLIVIAILAVMAGMSISALGDYIPDYRLNAAVRDLVADLHKAKAEAIKRNETITIVFNAEEDSSSGGAGSYLVFIDDGSGGGDSDNQEHDGEEVLLLTKYMPEDVILSSESSYAYVTFNQYGIPNTNGNAIIENTKEKKKKVTINKNGYIDIKKCK